MGRVPRATYRLQVHGGFPFAAALETLDYLEALGVSHLYLSPVFESASGSQHGYDCVDPTRVSRERGGEEGLRALARAARERGMGLVLDVVPNHMANVLPENRWWWDVLEKGRDSGHALTFDIDWEADARVVLPVLVEPVERLVERGELTLARRGDEVVVATPAGELPASPATAELLPAAQAESSEPELVRRALELQSWRLVPWRDELRERNWRRFFDIDQLVALRAHAEDVFHRTHGLLVELVREGVVDGLRIDHVDGLRDPELYLRRLRGVAPEAWIVAEKILQPDEPLPATWPVAGTTGYDFLDLASRLLLAPEGEEPLRRLFAELTGEQRGFEEIVRDCRRLVLEQLFPADLERAARPLARLLGGGADEDESVRERARETLEELLVHLPVYRTYVRPEQEDEVAPRTRELVEEAVTAARDHRSDLVEMLELVRGCLLLSRRGDAETELVHRIQELAPAVMAKAVEDTADYRYVPLALLCEVGSDPGLFSVSPAQFHERMRERAERHPEAMLTLSTHDTKRSGDVRARLALLSEVPDVWAEAVRRWCEHNEEHRTGGSPDRAAELLLYQTLVGAWPIDVERASAYMEKAAREAKARTSWRDPDPDYEQALRRFVEGVLADPWFRDQLEEFCEPLLEAGRIHALLQTLLLVTAPGVPDLYQGSELWDLSLVDPDNRRPVDFELRRRLLSELEGMSAEEAWERREEGLPKLYLVRQALRLRRERPQTFAAGSPYVPLALRGSHAESAIGFVRGRAPLRVAALGPLRLFGEHEGWGDDEAVELPEGSWRDLLGGATLTGGPVRLGELLESFPAALLAEEAAR